MAAKDERYGNVEMERDPGVPEVFVMPCNDPLASFLLRMRAAMLDDLIARGQYVDSLVDAAVEEANRLRDLATRWHITYRPGPLPVWRDEDGKT